MKKLYLDMTHTDGCMSLFVRGAEIIQAGTTVYSMQVKDKNAEYQKFADEYDIHFIFDDNIPVMDFYAVPRVDIMAIDSAGGYIGTIGGTSDLEGSDAICYIDSERNVFLAADNFKDFIDMADSWKTHLRPCGDVDIFCSKDEAEKVYEFVSLNDSDD